MHTEICGKINYRNSESLKTAVKRLEKWGWVTKDHFADNSGNYIDDEMPDIDYKKLTIEILWFSYHNLVMHLDNLFAKGKVVWASSDGEFWGGLLLMGKKLYITWLSGAKVKALKSPLMKMRMRMRIQ